MNDDIGWLVGYECIVCKNRVFADEIPVSVGDVTIEVNSPDFCCYCGGEDCMEIL